MPSWARSSPYIFLNHFAPNVGWRLAFLLGPVLAIFVIIVGRVLPESPRWLVTHGRQEEADKVMAKIEEAVRKSGQELDPIDESKAIEIVPETRYGYLTFLRLAFHQYTRRAILGATRPAGPGPAVRLGPSAAPTAA